jgi:hypothetical protein
MCESWGTGNTTRFGAGQNIFKVLTPKGANCSSWNLHVFGGEIERIEQETADGSTRHWLISKIPMWAVAATT